MQRVHRKWPRQRQITVLYSRVDRFFVFKFNKLYAIRFCWTTSQIFFSIFVCEFSPSWTILKIIVNLSQPQSSKKHCHCILIYFCAENSLKLENKHSLFELEYILLDNNNRMLLKNGRNYSDPDLFEWWKNTTGKYSNISVTHVPKKGRNLVISLYRITSCPPVSITGALWWCLVGWGSRLTSVRSCSSLPAPSRGSTKYLRRVSAVAGTVSDFLLDKPTIFTIHRLQNKGKNPHWELN